MPGWVRWFAEYQPFTPVIDTLRGATAGHADRQQRRTRRRLVRLPHPGRILLGASGLQPQFCTIGRSSIEQPFIRSEEKKGVHAVGAADERGGDFFANLTLSVSPALSMPATQTPPALSAHTFPRKVAGVYIPLAAPACHRARRGDRASSAGSVHRRACRMASLAWAMRWRARYNTRRSRHDSPCQLSSPLSLMPVLPCHPFLPR
jgi:hypothetical protein